jgi:hypothetical protein
MTPEANFVLITAGAHAGSSPQQQYSSAAYLPRPPRSNGHSYGCRQRRRSEHEHALCWPGNPPIPSTPPQPCLRECVGSVSTSQWRSRQLAHSAALHLSPVLTIYVCVSGLLNSFEFIQTHLLLSTFEDGVVMVSYEGTVSFAKRALYQYMSWYPTYLLLRLLMLRAEIYAG